MFEKIVRNIDELNAVALHLRTTENFDALKSLAKEWKISKQDTEAFICGKKYRLAEVAIEDRDYSRPEEKLRIEMFALKDKYFADIIGRYIIKKCIDDDFGKNVLLKHKSLQKCLDHIMEKAFHIAEDQAKQNGQEHIQQNAALAFPETQVFHWAEEYYLLDDLDSEQKKEEEKNKKIQEEWANAERLKVTGTSKSGSKKTTSKKRKAAVSDNTANSKVEEKRENDKPAVEQMNMFDLLANMS